MLSNVHNNSNGKNEKERKDPTRNITNKLLKTAKPANNTFHILMNFQTLHISIIQCEKGNKCTCILGFTSFFSYRHSTCRMQVQSPTVYILATFQSGSRMFRQRKCIFGKCRLRQSSYGEAFGLMRCCVVYKDMHPCLSCHAMPCIVMYFHLIFQSAIGCHDWCLVLNIEGLCTHFRE